MPEITSQDRESYQKLYVAAEALSTSISSINVSSTNVSSTNISSTNILESLNPLKGLTSAFFSQLIKPEALSRFDQLQSQVELTGGYLTVYQLFVTAIEAITEENAIATKAAINEASQRLSIQYSQLKLFLEAKASREADDDDFLDGVTTPHSDPLFLGLLTDSTFPNVKNWTQQILSDRPPALMDDQVQNLINAWGTAVTEFVEDARKSGASVDPGQSKTIAHFFCIHDQLEGLYGELSTSVALHS